MIMVEDDWVLKGDNFPIYFTSQSKDPARTEEKQLTAGAGEG